MNDELCLSVLRPQESVGRTALRFAASATLDAAGNAVILLGSSLTESERKILQQAKVNLQKDASTTPALWQISCHGETWACSVNDNRLARGKALSLGLGDCVEIGLLRLQVITAAEVALFSSPDSALVDGVENAEANTFDLSELAGRQVPGNEDDPFDMVGVHIPYLDAEPLPDSSELLSPDSTPTTATSQTEPPAQLSGKDADILAHLSNEYAKVITDPDYLHRQHWGEEAPEPINYTVQSPAELVQGLDAHHSLEDIVSGPLTIQDILDKFKIDDFQALEITEPAASDEVLSLFAQGVLTGGKKQAGHLSAIIRNDHHRVSMDSHYQPEEVRSDFQSEDNQGRKESKPS